MKKILFVLPLSMLLAYCSSTKPVITPGVSNVQLNGTAASTTVPGNDKRDWTYSSSRDTAMNGLWQLEGLLATDGSWKTSESMMPKVDTATVMVDSTQPAMSGVEPTNKTASGNKTFAQKLYDTSVHYFDTAAYVKTLNDKVKPFAYWQRLPEIKIMADLGIFTGNTGCNSMSGSFNFSGKDIRIDPAIRLSKMACNEYDETAFVNNLVKIDHYTINNNILELKQGNTTVLTFKRKTL